MPFLNHGFITCCLLVLNIRAFYIYLLCFTRNAIEWDPWILCVAHEIIFIFQKGDSSTRQIIRYVARFRYCSALKHTIRGIEIVKLSLRTIDTVLLAICSIAIKNEHISYLRVHRSGMQPCNQWAYVATIHPQSTFGNTSQLCL